MSVSSNNALDSLFHPKNVAFVGASPKGQRGNRFILSYIRQNFKGKIFPVHPTADAIMGFKAYPSVMDIPDEVDLMIFSIPYTAVMQVMRDCVEKGVKFVHLFTAGFSETGLEENIRLEQEVLALAREGGVRIVGPNCMGLYCPEGGIAWDDNHPNISGPVGFVSQSGQLASMFINEASSNHGLYFSKVVSFGNAADLQAHDFLNYLADDDKTRIIGSYIEGLKDGRAFFEFAREITRKKPLVVWKGGQTEGGGRATQSHTASIAGSPKIWKALCKQTGVISVDSMEELAATIAALLRLPKTQGTNVAVLGGAGGGSVTMTDMAEKEGLKVPHLSENTINTLLKTVPISGTSVKNPLDIGFSSMYEKQDEFFNLFALLRDDPRIDAMIFSRGNRPGRGRRNGMEQLNNMVLKGMDIIKKPVLVVLNNHGTVEAAAQREEAVQKFNAANVPTFASFPLAARVLKNMSDYNDFLNSPAN